MLISQIRDLMIVIYLFKLRLQASAHRLGGLPEWRKSFENIAPLREEQINSVITPARVQARNVDERNQIDKLLAQQNILIRFNKWIGEIYRISMLILVMLFLCLKGTLHVNRNETGWGGPHGEFNKQTFYSIPNVERGRTAKCRRLFAGNGREFGWEWMIAVAG